MAKTYQQLKKKLLKDKEVKKAYDEMPPLELSAIGKKALKKALDDFKTGRFEKIKSLKELEK